MEMSLTRRSLSRLVVAGGLAVTGGTSSRLVAAARSNGIESGGIGMSRPEWEAVFGAGDPGQSYMIYTYPTFGATMHVGFDTTTHPDGVLDYFYISLAETPMDGGLDSGLALNMIASLLPQDGRRGESFVRTETPGSLMMVTTEIWSSRSLGQVLNGRRSILVRYIEAPDSTVTLVTIDVERA